MKKALLFWALSLIMLGGFAQKVSRQKVFQVNGYAISQIGYPSKIVPTSKGRFAYIEYWTQGEGRQFPNYYLQSYNEKLEEDWFRPVSKQGTPEFKVFDLIRTSKAVAVVGKQYSASSKAEVTMAQFFNFDGQEQGAPVKVSNYDKKAKTGFVDEFSLSPDSTKLLWMGHNSTASYKKRRYFFSVLDEKGGAVWSKPLIVPYVDQKYVVRQAEVDKRGNLYLLLTFETATNTAKDTVNLPILLRYDFKENTFTEYKLDLPKASVPECRIKVTDKGELTFLGVLADGSEKGFTNGAKRYEMGLKWNKLSFKVFNIERDLKLSKEYVMDLPDSWVTKYGANGSNFSKAEVVEYKGKIYWVMEEFYTQIHNKQDQFLYYDIAVVAMDPSSGAILWANTVEKKQRDYNSGRLLSYVMGITGGKLHFVYLTERGAQGKIACSSLDLNTGESSFKALVGNENSDFLFFPKRSSMIGTNRMMLMGVGNPVGNEYKLIEIGF